MQSTDTAEDAQLARLALPVSQKVILVIDLVESVRLMAADEAGTVARWHAFVQHAKTEIIPAHNGRLVKSLGDGLMVEFDLARDAVHAALALHRQFDPYNSSVDGVLQLHLRAGINSTHVYTDQLDIYGAGVNLAARLATLAAPGETIASENVRDQLSDGLDAELEDLGARFVKHLDQAVHVYRVARAGAVLPTPWQRGEYAVAMQPTIAVIPFASQSSDPAHHAIGELVADGVIAILARSKELLVISRLSATAFRSRSALVNEIAKCLGADFVLSGSYSVIGTQGGGKLLLTTELADAKSGQAIWFDRFNAELGDLLESESQCTQRIAQASHVAILSHEAQRVRRQPLSSLAAYSLKLSGITLMHRSQVVDFENGLLVLNELAQRHRRIGDTHAWLAKWYVLRVMRGISPTPKDDAQRALECCNTALDADPQHALALAVRGHALSQMFGSGEGAGIDLKNALLADPNEVHGWLYKSVWSSLYGSTSDAVREALTARELSPLDPHSAYFDTILSGAYAFNHEYDNAIRIADRSLKLDYNHAPTLRGKLLAQVEAGYIEDARETLARLLVVTPDLSVAGYQAVVGAENPRRLRVVAALRRLSVPEST